MGTDQFLTVLLMVAHLFSLSDPAGAQHLLDASEMQSVATTRRQVSLLLNRYLRAKCGPKKASSKTHHHFHLMGMLKKVGKIYMEKKLNLMQADRISDIHVADQQQEAVNATVTACADRQQQQQQQQQHQINSNENHHFNLSPYNIDGRCNTYRQ